MIPAGLKKLILGHIRAIGPVSFANIHRHVEFQTGMAVENYVIADALSALIRAGEVDLYDTGDSFV